MGQVIDSFKSSLGIVRDNPAILGVSFALVLLVTLVTAPALLSDPSRMVSLSTTWQILLSITPFFIAPFFTGGLLGMVVEATEKPTNLSTFIEAGKRNYVSLLKALVLFFAILWGSILTAIILFILLKGASLFKLLFLPLIATITIVVFLIAMMLLQFYDIGIVVHHYGTWEAFKKSFAFARAQLLSVFYYSLLKGFLMLLFVIPIVAIRVYSVLQTKAGLMALAEGSIFAKMLIPSILLLGTVSLAVGMTFHGVFYLRSQEKIPSPHSAHQPIS